MKYLWLVLLVSCAKADARGPARPLTTTVELTGTGDTVRIVAHWAAGDRATSYLVGVTALNTTGLWVGLPNNRVVNGLTTTVIATNTTADSADFILCVISVNSSGLSPGTCSAARRWRRPPGAPPVVVIDTVALLVFPHDLEIGPGEQAFVCLAWRFPNGHVVLRTVDTYRSISAYHRTCLNEYNQSFTREAQAVTAGELAAANARIGERWSAADTSLLQVESLAGGILTREQFAIRWAAWAQNHTPSPNITTRVMVKWGDQQASADILIRSQGWYVAP